MHDAAAIAYDLYELEPSTVGDLDDWDPRKDLTVQIQLDDGFWHRKMIRGLCTACDEPQPIDYRLGQPVRHESYWGRLCRKGCFSKGELAESERLNTEGDPP